MIWDREFGFLKGVLVAPIPQYAPIVGKALSGTALALVQGGIVMVFAPVIGVKLGAVVIVKSLAIMALIGFSMTSIGLITLMLIVISFIGITRLAMLSEQVDDLSLRYIQAQGNLLNADRDLQQALVAERSVLSVEGGSDFFNAFESDHRLNLDQTYDGVKSYVELMNDEPARAAHAEFLKLAKVWEETSLKVIETMRTGTQADALAAMAMSVYKGEPEFNAMRSVLDGEQGRLEARLGEYRVEADQAYASARTTLVGVSLAGIALNQFQLSRLRLATTATGTGHAPSDLNLYFAGLKN